MKLADVQKILNGCDSNIFLYGLYNYYNLLSLQLYRHVSHYIIALFRKWFSFAKLNPCMGFPPEIFPGVETTGRPVFIASPPGSYGDLALLGYFRAALCGHRGMLFLCGRVCPSSRPWGFSAGENREFPAVKQRVPYQNERMNRSQ